MEGVIHGGIKAPGLSPSKAKEFVENVDYQKLPKKKKKKRFDKLLDK